MTSNQAITKPNILILINDQQRFEQDWPASWQAENLPSMARLKCYGCSFNNAFTATCACTPSRASLLTGTYPSQTGVFHNLKSPGDTSVGTLPSG